MRATEIPLREIAGAPGDYDGLLEAIGDSSLVLIGEASHGTHEFYRERARITRRLIEERGFRAVAAEADWPDAYRVNRYLHGAPDDGDAEEALRGFRRFPTWMWRNAEVLDFLGWLRSHNDRSADAEKAGFFGLDVYSLYSSIEAVIAYLEKMDPPGAERARERYSCFEQFGGEQAYGRAVALGVSATCERGVVEQLLELQRNADSYLRRDGFAAEDEQFCAEQNARVVAGAESYYRSMFGSAASSWNLRDRHMADTLEHLRAHLARRGAPAKVVVWEHNSHLGDARMTEMSRRGELNVGQLVRERHGDDAFSIGFTTHAGTVTAASDWGGPAECKRVRPALPGSWEQLLHQAQSPRFWLDLRDPDTLEVLPGPRLERAIGVIYRPETERQSHYFFADLAGQFDAVIHIDETRAVEPLERTAGWERGELPETYPTSL
ncbi:MAG TPA: erythromycin esterase family protein [Solirubrobacterales bacterium]|nr:erythromycin esterase family protein [Solirubrobacterales bacterium]